jgi:hypothetical protein
MTSVVETGFAGVIVGDVEKFELDDLIRPLIYYRGRYRHLD